MLMYTYIYVCIYICIYGNTDLHVYIHMHRRMRRYGCMKRLTGGYEQIDSSVNELKQMNYLYTRVYMHLQIDGIVCL